MPPISLSNCNPAGSELAGASESFGEGRVPASAGWEALERAGWSEVLGPPDQLLPELPRALRPELVDRLLVRLALQVLDLPASQWHHHSHPFGMLRHLLEVGVRAYRLAEGLRADSPPGPAGPGPGQDLITSYGAFVLGLFHDLGKLGDLEVRPPQGGRSWNPLGEPLAQYCLQLGEAQTGPRWWFFRRGRGLEGHVFNFPFLACLVLPEAASRFLGPDLFHFSGALMAASTGARLYNLPARARGIADIVLQADRESARNAQPKTAAAFPAAGSSGPPGRSGETSEGTPSTGRRVRALLEEAITGTMLPLNAEGGILVGSQELLLPYPSGVDALLPGIVPEGKEKARDLLLRDLKREGWLPLVGRTGRLVESGRAEPQRGKPWEGPMVALARSILPGELPPFRGQLRIHLAGSSEGFWEARPAGAGDRSSLSAGPLEAEPPAKRLYQERVALEQDANRLLDLHQQGMEDGYLRLNRMDGEVFHQKGILYVRQPSGLERLLRRRGIASTPELLARMLSLLLSYRPGSSGSPPCRGLQVRLHPDSPEAEPVLTIPVALLLPGDHGRKGLGEWGPRISQEAPHWPGAWGQGGPPGGSPLELSAQGRGTPRSRRLQRFSRAYQALWDLSQLKLRAIAGLLGLAREFEEDIRGSRLVLYPRRSYRESTYYALYWGELISALKGWKNPRKRIRHISQKMSPELLAQCGRHAQAGLFLQFDRRRIAQNLAYKLVASAGRSIHLILRSKVQARPEPDLPIPLPPVRGQAELSPLLEVAARGLWNLLGRLEDQEIALEHHARSTERAESASRLWLAFRCEDSPEGKLRLAWALPEEGAWFDRLTGKRQRALRLPRRWRVPAFEAGAKRLLRAYENTWDKLGRVLALSKRARAGALEELALSAELEGRGSPSSGSRSFGHSQPPPDEAGNQGRGSP